MAVRLVLAAAALVLLYQAWLFGWVLWYAYMPPGSTSVMRSELSRLQERDPHRRLNYQWVDYARISNNLKRAAVAAEDANFLEHGGIDWNAVEKAYDHNRQLAEAAERAVARGRKPPSRPMRGGSTITQQVAKNLFLSNSRNYLRKGQEVVITYMIELVMTKQRILELYLNIAEWGEGSSAPRRRPGTISIPRPPTCRPTSPRGWLPCCPGPGSTTRTGARPTSPRAPTACCAGCPARPFRDAIATKLARRPGHADECHSARVQLRRLLLRSACVLLSRYGLTATT